MGETAILCLSGIGIAMDKFCVLCNVAWRVGEVDLGLCDFHSSCQILFIFQDS